MNGPKNEPPCAGAHPFNSLPGDPSLLLVTNVDLGEKKMEIMKGQSVLRDMYYFHTMTIALIRRDGWLVVACSKLICQHTGKPESYIAVSIKDNASVIFGGTDAPTALGNLYSVRNLNGDNDSFMRISGVMLTA